MGYTTDFSGVFLLNKKLDQFMFDYLTKFNESRRMKRKLPSQFGIDGEYFVDGVGFMGQGDDSSVVDHNRPPSTQPGLWCHWRPTEDGMGIEWDGGEKFYEYIPWLAYVISNFLEPYGYKLNGEVTWQGEDVHDHGKIIVENNEISICESMIKYTKPKKISRVKITQQNFLTDRIFEQKVLESK